MITINMKISNGHTAIPNEFIDIYMPSAEHPLYATLYIYFYRHCLSNNTNVSLKSVASTFQIMESDVIKSFMYWEKLGLMRSSSPSGKFEMSTDEFAIEFLPLPLSVQQNTVLESINAEPTEAAEPVSEKIISPELNADKPKTAKKRIKPIILETKPHYSVEEIEIYKQDSQEITELFKIAEQYFGTLFDHNDLNVMISLYAWLRLPLDVIDILLSYCAENNHLNMRYIEKVAVDWATNEINTAERAKEHLNIFNGAYREIMKAFGQSNLNPTKTQINYMDKWLTELKTELPVILEACDRTRMETNKASFPYCDKIILNWNEQGVKTLEDVKRVTAEFKEQKNIQGKPDKQDKQEAKAPAKRNNRFANFKQREYNTDDIMKVQRAYLNN